MELPYIQHVTKSFKFAKLFKPLSLTFVKTRYLLQPMKNKRLNLIAVASFALLFATSGQAIAQSDFYDINTIQEINITFNQSNWDYMMDTAATGSEGYIVAAQVTINGVAYDSVGVKYKGNSSYNANNAKNPLHIELDYIKGNQSYQGYTDIKLSNGFKDPSFAREPASYEILRNYMHAPKANYARVKINGNYTGLFMSAEAITKKFVGDHFYSSNGTFFKCNPIGGAGPGGGGSPSLIYLGNDSTLYLNNYELKSDYGWNDLVSFINELNNNSGNAINVLDVDRALWMLAFNNVLVNLDSYTGGFSQNYYLYKDVNQRFNTISWDLNESFGSFTNSGAGNLTLTQEQQMSPLLHETNTAKPLISKLMANPEYKRRYLAHMRTIINEQFANNLYVNRIQAMQAIADSSVQADNNKFYTYTQFQNSLTTAVAGGMGSIPGITQLMGARTTWLLSQSQFTATPPSISNVTAVPSTPSINTTVTINCTVTGSTVVKLGYRDATWKRFEYLQMFDDGSHNDGASGDGVFGSSFTVTSPLSDYYVYAENGSAGIFSPERAEHEFYQLTAALSTAASGEVNFNEFLAVNQNDTTDAIGAHEDWIEMVNTTSQPLSLFGLYLSDDATQLTKWAFPAGTVIPANGFLLVWADEDNNPAELHCNFKLSSAGEEIYLTNSNGTIYDYYIFGPQSADISYGRCPDATGPWQPFLNTTPKYGNDCPTGISSPENETTAFIFPNPASNIASVGGVKNLTHLECTDLTGKVIWTANADDLNQAGIPLQNFKAGIYLVKINNTTVRKLVVNK